ncbi:hypothetical protein [Phenylobacterium sp.]|uniref:hypothetical protein n=1 Tax=Phenylobacterium sp. TaxID=1871053 RepID=UPI0035B46A41
MSDDLLRSEADAILGSGALGRSPLLKSLFEYLLGQSLEGRRVTEFDVASEVFDRGEQFSSTLDASVRVYIHRLRRKLDEYYSGPGHAAPQRIVIPNGEYRLVMEDRAAAAGHDAAQPRPIARTALPRWIFAAAAALVVVNVGVWAWFSASHPVDPLREVRRSEVWSPLVTDSRPMLVVLGDYFIFGETDGGPDVRRLVREFDVNSSDDLDRHKLAHPGTAGRYVDLELRYLPVGAGVALRKLLPVVAGPDPDRVRVILMSELTPDMLKTHDILYVGYLSGLGLLETPTFAGSRFAIGMSYDELIDLVDQQHYVSQAGAAVGASQPHVDYGYVASYRGPNGGRIMVIAGTRDVALIQAAEALARRSSLDELVGKAGGADAFEALYMVEGLARTNLDGKLVLAAPLKAQDIWTPRAEE